MESSKKQRNKKNQKESAAPKNTKSTSNKEGITIDPNALQKQPIHEEVEPQPQRAPRRPRNEQAAPSDSRPNVLQISSTPTITAKKIETQEPVVDHSNLKRETEEIAKLNKKFTKRKITSNWHRYSAPEGSEDPSGEDGSAPADFSHLLEVPVSRGGHLTLKDEQDWSSGSGSTLGGYFALDLKKLNQSLACIPLYDQLHIPKHMFTVEEIQEFDDLAKENKKSFNPESETNKSNNTSNQDPISHRHKIALEVSQKCTSILQEDPILIDIGSQSKQNLDSNIFANLGKLKDDEAITGRLVEEQQDVSLKCNKPKTNANDKTINNDSNFNNYILDGIENKSEESKAKERIISESEIMQNGSSESKHVPVQSLPVAPSSKPQEVPSANINNLTVDDDDDLDFLLSLKTPVPAYRKSAQMPSSTAKDSSSSLERKDVQLPAHGKSSELDDWLDSVLED